MIKKQKDSFDPYRFANFFKIRVSSVSIRGKEFALFPQISGFKNFAEAKYSQQKFQFRENCLHGRSHSLHKRGRPCPN